MGGATSVIRGVKNGIGYSVDGVKNAFGRGDDDRYHRRYSKRSTNVDNTPNQQRLFKRAPVPLQEEHSPVKRSLEAVSEETTMYKVSWKAQQHFVLSTSHTTSYFSVSLSRQW
jgi:hypothetical protein